ncbi:MAG TPA: archaemetzincin [Phycisphaerae bacterium]|nr:archaemetzincin [Phycisphaerae bacterium]
MILLHVLNLCVALALPRQVDDPADPLLNPQVNVARDPASWYTATLFEKLSEPQPGEWREAHPEPVQSFAEYVRSRPNRPRQVRKWIILQPLGTVTGDARERLETLRAYLSIYYTLPVRAEPWISLANVRSREREMAGRTFRQYLTGDILYNLLLPRVKIGTFAMLGVTMDDLYPEESWNYVFGQASLKHRVGVYSLTRFYPEFWGDEETGESDRLGLKRSLKTLVHETGHMFGVRHCQKYECVMNGSNSLRESDGRPMHLCPGCLKKFRWNIGFDIIGRCEALKAFYEAHEMADEAEWVGKRLAECRDSPAEGTGGDAAPDAGEDNAKEE